MAVDALFYSGESDLLVSTDFWDSLGEMNTKVLAQEAFIVILFALLTAIPALPPQLFTVGIYDLKRQMKMAEMVGRRILLQHNTSINWQRQLSVSLCVTKSHC